MSQTIDRREWRRRSRRSFLALGAAGVLGALGLAWVYTRNQVGQLPWPLRAAHNANGKLWQTLYGRGRLGVDPPAPPRGTPYRVNGDIGLMEEFDPSTWRLAVSTPGSGRGSATLTMADLSRMPQTETTELFKCIEGWSMPIAYSGVRFSDFILATGAGMREGKPRDLSSASLYPYVGLATPDGEYYVSLDMESALHPKTLLATGINGVPLSDEHGAPLRLIVPVKYGIKSLKRIGRIFFADQRPPDYWAEQGYDWYAGL
ncbi:MAG: molybdopterin-dependent oxidoreductase [SAR324 cluster bacterium]